MYIRYEKSSKCLYSTLIINGQHRLLDFGFNLQLPQPPLWDFSAGIRAFGFGVYVTIGKRFG